MINKCISTVLCCGLVSIAQAQETKTIESNNGLGNQKVIRLTEVMGGKKPNDSDVANGVFLIRGSLRETANKKVVLLSYNLDGQQIVDSATVENDSFLFKGLVGQPVKASLRLKVKGEVDQPITLEGMATIDRQEFYLEPVEIIVNGTDKIKTAQISGGKTQEDYNDLQEQLKPLQEKMAPLSDKMKKLFELNDEAGTKELFPQLRAIRMDMDKIEAAFVLSHPDSYLSFDWVMARSGMIEPATFEPFFNSLNEKFRQTKQGQEVAEQLKLAKRLDIGQPAIEFSQETPEGKNIALSSLKGKYVLIDFWASWCGPCRGENPNLVKSYNRFKDKNFEILAVSLDNKKEAWLKAIKDDGLPWIHVSDLKGWKNEVAALYGVRAIPQNVLIDDKGIIVAKNLRGEELEKKLSEILRTN